MINVLNGVEDEKHVTIATTVFHYLKVYWSNNVHVLPERHIDES